MRGAAPEVSHFEGEEEPFIRDIVRADGWLMSTRRVKIMTAMVRY